MSQPVPALVRSAYISLALVAILLTACVAGDDAAEASSADAADNNWTTLETEGEPSARHENAFVESGGRFYLIGGRGERPVDIYDPSRNTWTAGAAPPLEIHHFQAVAYDGKIYVVGAWTGGFPDERGIEHVLIYDPDDDSWSTGAAVPEERRRGAAGVVVHDNHIYVVAGNRGGHGPHATAVSWFDRFDPSAGTWETLPPAPRGRDHFHAAVLDGKLYAVGGRDSGVEGFIDSTIAAVDVYDFAAETWTTLDGSPLPTERAGSTTVAAGGRVIITGGEGFGQTWGETEALDAAAGTWSLIGRLNQPRHGSQAIVHDGKIWIAAGSGGQGGGPELTSMEIYKLETGN